MHTDSEMGSTNVKQSFQTILGWQLLPKEQSLTRKHTSKSIQCPSPGKAAVTPFWDKIFFFAVWTFILMKQAACTGTHLLQTGVRKSGWY